MNEELFKLLKEYYILNQIIFLSKNDEKQIEAEMLVEVLTEELREHEELFKELESRL